MKTEKIYVKNRAGEIATWYVKAGMAAASERKMTTTGGEIKTIKSWLEHESDWANDCYVRVAKKEGEK
jgi:hypothetical protein